MSRFQEGYLHNLVTAHTQRSVLSPITSLGTISSGAVLPNSPGRDEERYATVPLETGTNDGVHGLRLVLEEIPKGSAGKPGSA